MTDQTETRPQDVYAGGRGSGRPIIRVEDLSMLIRRKRESEGLTLEQASVQSEIPLATLARWERLGRMSPGDLTRKSVPAPETRTLALLSRWLHVSLHQVLDVEQPAEGHSITHREDDTVPDIVQAHLRADRKLDEKTAASLGKLFRLAYEQYTQFREEPADPASDDPQQATSEREQANGEYSPRPTSHT